MLKARSCQLSPRTFALLPRARKSRKHPSIPGCWGCAGDGRCHYSVSLFEWSPIMWARGLPATGRTNGQMKRLAGLIFFSPNNCQYVFACSPIIIITQASISFPLWQALGSVQVQRLKTVLFPVAIDYCKIGNGQCMEFERSHPDRFVH